MKWLKRFGIAFLCILLLGIGTSVIIVNLTPNPIAHLTRIGFSGGEEGVVYGRHPDYVNMQENIRIEKDLSYPSKYEQANFDAYYPKDTTQSYPVLLWVHGGAFVGGDKNDIENFATSLSSQGYVVLCMNYALAPEATYPTPLIQTMEMVSYLPELTKQLPMELSSFFIGGDSAGAQIAFQFLTTQTNETYREKLDLPLVIEPSTIKGAISFCGLLDLSQYDTTDSRFSNFLYDQSAWAYFKQKDWKEALRQNGADFSSYLTSSFPPVYLTDGDLNSFLKQAEEYKALLLQQGIEVVDLLWQSGEHPHEYQFHLDQDAGLQNFNQVLQFLEFHKAN